MVDSNPFVIGDERELDSTGAVASSPLLTSLLRRIVVGGGISINDLLRLVMDTTSDEPRFRRCSVFSLEVL